MGNLLLNTASAAELVTDAEAKTHLRVDHTADDALIALMVKAARVACENYTGMSIINTTWEWSLDENEIRGSNSALSIQDVTGASDKLGVIELPRYPLSSVTSITSYNDANTGSTFANTSYYIDVNSAPGRVALVQGQTWPSNLRAIKSLVILYVSGFGANAAAVKADISEVFEAAIKITLADMYEHRGDDEKAAKRYSLPPTAKMLLQPHRVVWG